jgi:hypothetical protein
MTAHKPTQSGQWLSQHRGKSQAAGNWTRLSRGTSFCHCFPKSSGETNLEASSYSQSICTSPSRQWCKYFKPSSVTELGDILMMILWQITMGNSCSSRSLKCTSYYSLITFKKEVYVTRNGTWQLLHELFFHFRRIALIRKCKNSLTSTHNFASHT